jgi:hypothetical protein
MDRRIFNSIALLAAASATIQQAQAQITLEDLGKLLSKPGTGQGKPITLQEPAKPAALPPAANARSTTLEDLTSADASKGLKTALEKGALAAVGVLGAKDGFLGNERVRIPLPGYLNDAAQLLRTFGQGAQVDELLLSMNRAAEAAVPMSRDLLLNAVQTMSIADAKGILSGGNTAVTDYFASKTRSALTGKFLPVVTTATAKVGLATQYNALAGKATELGLVKKEVANIQQYVTGKTLDGLYLMIGEEEKKIRQNPMAYGSAILGKVFGALQ